MEKLYWTGKITCCDICCAEFENVMYDAKCKAHEFGQAYWGNVCQSCMDNDKDAKIGFGYGQKYEKQSDGKWLCVAGRE